jgi:hypothetical protein
VGIEAYCLNVLQARVVNQEKLLVQRLSESCGEQRPFPVVSLGRVDGRLDDGEVRLVAGRDDPHDGAVPAQPARDRDARLLEVVVLDFELDQQTSDLVGELPQLDLDAFHCRGHMIASKVGSKPTIDEQESSCGVLQCKLLCQMFAFYPTGWYG